MSQNSKNSFLDSFSFSVDPFPSSQKIYLKGKLYPEIRVPMREISLTNGEKFTVYDTSGPYTDSQVKIDITTGLPKVRECWLRERNNIDFTAVVAKPKKNR